MLPQGSSNDTISNHIKFQLKNSVPSSPLSSKPLPILDSPIDNSDGKPSPSEVAQPHVFTSIHRKHRENLSDNPMNTYNEQKETQITEALKIISNSMQPSRSTIDDLLQSFKSTIETNFPDDSRLRNFVLFLLGAPLDALRSFVKFFLIEIHLVYNVSLMMVSIVETPPIFFYLVGFILFWIKILIEFYRDILHRNEQFFASYLGKELSLGAAISASYGIILKFKIQTGSIDDAWWAEWTNWVDSL